MHIEFNYLEKVRPGLAKEMAEEMKAWDKWMVQEGRDQSHFEHSAGGDGIGHIGPSCLHFEEWMFEEGVYQLEDTLGHRLEWAHRPTATRWKPGDFLRIHTDGGDNRVYTYNINLSFPWKEDWGGHLLALNEETQVWETVPTRMDRMVIFHDRSHYVSPVAAYATETRYAITAWFQNEEEARLLPIPSGKGRRPPRREPR